MVETLFWILSQHLQRFLLHLKLPLFLGWIEGVLDCMRSLNSLGDS